MNMAEELQKWLEDIDTEEYLEKFKELGVKKCKHLCDVTHQHLLDMGMLELERKRFFEKLELAKKDHVEYINCNSKDHDWNKDANPSIWTETTADTQK